MRAEDLMAVASEHTRDFEGTDLEDPLKPSTAAHICPLLRLNQQKGLKLHWPHAGDRRRAQVGNSIPPVTARNGSPDRSGHYLNIVSVSSRDMQMHYQFTGVSGDADGRPVLEVPLVFDPLKEDMEHHELFEYFQHTASQSLAVFGHHPGKLGNAIVRTALSCRGLASTAVIKALLAFSALHRWGPTQQSTELKIQALKLLQDAPKSGRMETAEAACHVAAGMLLCAVEVHQACCTSGEWVWYVRGAKDVIRASGLDHLLHQEDSDIAILLDWVHYQYVLARFSLQHRRKDFAALSLDSLTIKAADIAARRAHGSPTPAMSRAEPCHSSTPALSLISLLSEVSDVVHGPPPPDPSTSEEHTNFLRILDWRIRTAAITAQPSDSSDTPVIYELFKLATLVYLSRAHPKLNPAARTQAHIIRGFELLASLVTCDRQFPVFILGIEARTDEQRQMVLDLISRTEESVSSRSWNYASVLLQAVWTQDDLAAGEVDYLDKLSFVISWCRILPTFV